MCHRKKNVEIFGGSKVITGELTYRKRFLQQLKAKESVSNFAVL